jgi:hypothetical protein
MEGFFHFIRLPELELLEINWYYSEPPTVLKDYFDIFNMPSDSPGFRALKFVYACDCGCKMTSNKNSC